MLLAALTAVFLLSAEAAPVPKVRMELVAPRTAAADAPLTVAVVLHVPNGWHIYWENPGQSGLATDVRLDAVGPDAEALPVTGPRWATPARIEADDLVSYGYEQDAAFVYTVAPPAPGKKKTPVALEATGSWVLCQDICVVGEGTGRGRVVYTPGRAAANPATPHLAALPAPLVEGGGAVTFTDGQLRVTLPGPGPFEVFPSAPLEAAWVPTTTTGPDGGLVLTSPLAEAPLGAHLVLTRGADATRAGFTLDLTELP